MSTRTFYFGYGNDTYSTDDYYTYYGDQYSSFYFYGEYGDDNLTSAIIGRSASEYLNGGRGNDYLKGWSQSSDHAFLEVEGGWGTDYFYSPTPLSKVPTFSRSGENTTFSLTDPDGSMLDVTVHDSVEFIALQINGQPKYYSTEYLSREMNPEVGFQEVYTLSYTFPDWYLNGHRTGYGGDTTYYFLNQTHYLPEIKDFGGTLHGGVGSDPRNAIPHGYKYQGFLDLNADAIPEFVFTNSSSGRWASVGFGRNFNNHGTGGDTRIVGIYIDPLVTSGEVIQFSDHDSQHRFQNDLKNDNLILKLSADFDRDGFQEVYWKTADNTAYLRALMHADGNIQYANYQNYEQMSSYVISAGQSTLLHSIVN